MTFIPLRITAAFFVISGMLSLVSCGGGSDPAPISSTADADNVEMLESTKL